MSRTIRRQKLGGIGKYFAPHATIVSSAYASDGETAYPVGWEDLIGPEAKRFAKREVARARRRVARQTCDYREEA